MGVQDPLKLAHHLELLGGTSALVDIINSKQADISTCSQRCNDLSDKSDQYSSALLCQFAVAAAAADYDDYCLLLLPAVIAAHCCCRCLLVLLLVAAVAACCYCCSLLLLPAIPAHSVAAAQARVRLHILYRSACMCLLVP